jgi:hypothetical protein
MQTTGTICALLGTALIVLAVLQFATLLLGDVRLLIPVLGVAGAVLLAVGAVIILRESQR